MEKFMLKFRAVPFIVSGIKIKGAASSLRIGCGKGEIYFRAENTKLECPHVARHGAVPLNCDNTRAFFIFTKYQNQRRHTMSRIWAEPRNKQDVIDRLENISSIIAFLTITISQVKCAPEYWLNNDGLFGLNNLLYFFEESLRDCSEVLSKGDGK